MTISIRSLCFLACILSIVRPCWAIDLTDFEISDPKVHEVYNEFKKRKKLRIDHELWKAEKGPWAQYLNVPFKNGLSPREKEFYEQALKNGQCHSVQSLQVAGFLMLYPHLRPVHARTAVADVFVETVVKPSHGYRYCEARRQLLETFFYIRANRLDVRLPIDAEAESNAVGHSTIPKTPTNRATGSLCTSLFLLSNLAISKDYKPAILDLLDFVDRTGVLRLLPEQDYYLRKRARHLKLSPATKNEDPNPAFYKIKPVQRRKIEKYAKDRQGTAPIRSLVKCPPSWGAIVLDVD